MPSCSVVVHQAQATGWEVTLERQKLRAQALADELGSLIEYAARKVLGKPIFCMFRSEVDLSFRPSYVSCTDGPTYNSIAFCCCKNCTNAFMGLLSVVSQATCTINQSSPLGD